MGPAAVSWKQTSTSEKVTCSVFPKDMRASMLSVRETPKWEEALAWQVCSTQERINIGTWTHGGVVEKDVQLVPVR